MIKLSKLSRGTLIRIDDIAENMNWQLMNKCEILFNKYDIKPVLGVIPKNKDPELLRFPKKKIFGPKLKTGKIVVGKFLCMDILMTMTLKLIKKIILSLVENQNFLVKV